MLPLHCETGPRFFSPAAAAAASGYGRHPAAATAARCAGYGARRTQGLFITP